MHYAVCTELFVIPRWYDDMCGLHDRIFRVQQSCEILDELQSKSKFLILVAVCDERVVGYKIGYQERRTRFYSWLGGVDQGFRGRGVASELMRRQHEWCKAQEYALIRTQTKNEWRDMLILNLKNGFDVIGAFTDEHGEPKIILEKHLRD